MSKMSLANVVRGKQPKPVRVVLYGADGVGKSTFGANAPSPIFLCSEDGTNHLDVARFPAPKSWGDVIEALTVLTNESHEYKTLVVDTLDWLEPLCWAQVCVAGGKHSIEDFGFGKGYVMALDLWRQFLARLDHLSKTRNMHIILLAHAQVKRVERPDHDAYDRYLLKLHDKTAALIREWADAVLFSQHEVIVSGADKRTGAKAKGKSTGNRVVHTEWCAAFDAKNRFDLPEILPLDWDEFFDSVKNATPIPLEKLRDDALEMIGQLPEAEREKATKVLNEWAGQDRQRIVQLTGKIKTKIEIGGQQSPPPSQPVAVDATA